MSHPDLYRAGNTTSPRLDNVRVGKDIIVVNGKVGPSELILFFTQSILSGHSMQEVAEYPHSSQTGPTSHGFYGAP
jgi:hypothetical protein